MIFINDPPRMSGDVILSRFETEMLARLSEDERIQRVSALGTMAGDTVVRKMEQPINPNDAFAIGAGLSDTPGFSSQESRTFMAMFNFTAGTAAMDLYERGKV